MAADTGSTARVLRDTSERRRRTGSARDTVRPQRPGAYLRISSDPFGLERGVSRQKEDSKALATNLGWGEFVQVYEENDTSAFKKKRITLPDGSVGWRVIRPEFARMLQDMRDGVIDGVIVYDLDRLARQPRDLEDLIDIVEHGHMPVEAVTGKIDLSDSNGRVMARMFVAMALKSSEDTSRRVATAAYYDAQKGKLVRGGPRRYGWDRDGITIREDEAEVIRQMTQRVLNGESVSGIALSLQASNVSTVTGAKWTRTTVNAILRSPRLAGIRAYQGREVEGGKPKINDWQSRGFVVDGEWVIGEWEPILTVPEWEGLQAALDSRRVAGAKHSSVHTGANTRKYVLSGIVRCGRCGCRMVGRKVRDVPAYGCLPKDMGGCNGVSRNQEKLDRFMLELVIQYLEQERYKVPKADRRTVRSSSNDAKTASVAELEERKSQFIEMFSGSPDMDIADFQRTIKSLNERIESARAEHARQEWAQRMTPVQARSLQEELVSPGTSLSRKRAIFGSIFEEITIMPSSRGPHFNPDDIIPKFRGSKDGV